MSDRENPIELKVGDVFRFNRARKHNTIVNEFEYNGEVYFNYVDDAQYSHMHTTTKEYLCTSYVCYGNVYDGVVEVNGKIVRGTGGKVLAKPKDVKVKEVPVKKKVNVVKPLTDFQRFVRVQASGRINMTDIVHGAMLAGISEQKYEDIMWHYDEYKSGIRQ